MQQQEMFERGDGHRSRRRAIAVLCAVSALALAMATTAQASVISIGSVLPKEFTPTKFERVQTLFNTALPQSGVNLASPVNGAVVRWRVQGAKGGPFHLRILHPNGKGAYEAAGTSLPVTPAGEGLETFSTNLQIQAGDLIGIDPSNDSDEIGIAVTVRRQLRVDLPDPFRRLHRGAERNVQRQRDRAQRRNPAAAGNHLDLTAVRIGHRWDAGDDHRHQPRRRDVGQIRCHSGRQLHGRFRHRNHRHAPSSLKPGKVDLSATTLAGTNVNTRFDDFVYQACVVPSLKNKTLKKAKTLLRRSGCKLGHVKKVEVPKAKKVGKVLKQAPKPGKILAPGARVRINLGK